MGFIEKLKNAFKKKDKGEKAAAKSAAKVAAVERNHLLIAKSKALLKLKVFLIRAMKFQMLKKEKELV